MLEWTAMVGLLKHVVSDGLMEVHGNVVVQCANDENR